jgi:hypothetical protein
MAASELNYRTHRQKYDRFSCFVLVFCAVEGSAMQQIQKLKNMIRTSSTYAIQKQDTWYHTFNKDAISRIFSARLFSAVIFSSVEIPYRCA